MPGSALENIAHNPLLNLREGSAHLCLGLKSSFRDKNFAEAIPSSDTSEKYKGSQATKDGFYQSTWATRKLNLHMVKIKADI